MDSIKPDNILQTVYVTDNNKIHKIVLRERNDEQDTFQASKPQEQTVKKKNKGFINQLFSVVENPIKKIKSYFKKEIEIPAEDKEIPVNNSEKQYDILITTVYKDIPQKVLPEENSVNNEVQNPPINFETRVLKAPSKSHLEKLIEKKKEERLIRFKQLIKPDTDAYKKKITVNGVENLISQTDNKITLERANQAISLELKKDDEGKTLVEAVFVDEEDKRSGNVIMDESRRKIKSGSGSFNANYQTMLKDVLELNKQNAETNFDYKTAEIIAKRKK